MRYMLYIATTLVLVACANSQVSSDEVNNRVNKIIYKTDRTEVVSIQYGEVCLVMAREFSVHTTIALTQYVGRC